MADVSRTQTDQGQAPDDERYATGPGASGPEQPRQDERGRSATPQALDETTAVDRGPVAARGPDARTPENGQMNPSAMDHQSTLVKEVSKLRARWESVQVGFVDDPRRAVSDAEALVGEVLDEMTAGFRDQRHQLESLWSNGREVSTEQLRQAIQRYHEFFERFLRV